MKINLNKIQILFVTMILVNVFLSGACFFLWQKIITTADQINISEQEVATLEFQKNNLYQLTTTVGKEIDPALEQINKYFVREDNYIKFVELLELLADKAQVVVEIRSIELKNSLQLSIDFQGSFNDSMYFVALVESLPINLKIENMRIEGAPRDDSWRGGVVIVLLGSGSGKN